MYFGFCQKNPNIFIATQESPELHFQEHKTNILNLIQIPKT